jgi:hypothetical protein
LLTVHWDSVSCCWDPQVNGVLYYVNLLNVKWKLWIYCVLLCDSKYKHALLCCHSKAVKLLPMHASVQYSDCVRCFWPPTCQPLASSACDDARFNGSEVGRS